MSDPLQPTAPFLTSEIVSKILRAFYIHPKDKEWLEEKRENREFEILSRISICWKLEAQRRLFESMRIDHVDKLVKVIESGLSQFIISLTIKIYSLESSSEIESNLLALLRSTSNLKFLSFFYSAPPSLTSNFLESTLSLPKLSTLHIYLGQQEWPSGILHQIINGSENLERLKIFSCSDYDGPLWSCKLPSTLRFLALGGSMSSILEGRVLPVSFFSGVETLDISSCTFSNGFETSMDFFESISSSLQGLKIDGYYSIPSWLWSSLIVLNCLEISRGFIKDVSTLPSTLTKFVVAESEGF